MICAISDIATFINKTRWLINILGDMFLQVKQCNDILFLQVIRINR